MDFYSVLLDKKLGESDDLPSDFNLYVTRNLTKVTTKMLDGITKIRDYVFYQYTSLTSVKIPKGVTRIGNYAFYNCTSLASITLPSGLIFIGNSTFGYCSGLTNVTLPNSVTRLDFRAFDNCTSLTSIIIPKSVTFIGDPAFNTCRKLSSVTVERTTPPTLNGTTYVFQSTASNLVIYVPAESVDAYKAATNWSTYASKIQAIPS